MTQRLISAAASGCTSAAYAAPPRLNPFRRKVAAYGPAPSAPTCMGQRLQTLSRSREKAPRNPNLWLRPERKPLVRRPCPMHETRQPAFRWWRGEDLNLRPSGYEPDELPDCSTPRRSRHPTRPTRHRPRRPSRSWAHRHSDRRIRTVGTTAGRAAGLTASALWEVGAAVRRGLQPGGAAGAGRRRRPRKRSGRPQPTRGPA